jgi:protein gp37
MSKSKKDSEWWDESIQLVDGCTPVSESCPHCWSAGLCHRFRPNSGLTTNGHFNGKVIFHEDRLQRLKKGSGKRIALWNDPFHESLDYSLIDKIVITAGMCPQNKILLLTKRIDNALQYFKQPDLFTYHLPTAIKEEMSNQVVPPPYWLLKKELPSNIEVGTTIENQPRADERVIQLLQIPAAGRFVSCTLMGPIDFGFCSWVGLGMCPQCGREHGVYKPQTGYPNGILPQELIHLIIVECERLPGNRAGRSCEDEALWWQWAKDIYEQCRAANVALWLKQGPKNGKVTDRLEDFPAWARVREYPINSKS